MNEPVHLRLCDLPQALQVLHLRIESVVCAIEPVAPSGSTMDSERSADCVTEFVGAELILTRKDLDSLRQTRATLYRHFQPTSQVVDVDPAVPCKQWLVREDPEVSTATGLFERRLNLILTQLPLQLQKILQSILIVSINCHPLGALRLRIQRVKASGQLTVQMLANGLERQSPILLRTIVVVLPVRARFVGLKRVGQAIYEQCKIPFCRFRARSAYSFHKVPSLSSPFVSENLYECRECNSSHPRFPKSPPEKRRMCCPRDEVVLRDKLIELFYGKAVVTSFVEDHKVED